MTQESQQLPQPTQPEAIETFTKTLLIEGYDLVDLLSKVQSAVQQGYILSLETLTHYPVAIGGLYTLTMVANKLFKDVTDVEPKKRAKKETT